MPLDEDDCRKKLTSYEVISIQKVNPRDPKEDKPTYAKAEHTRVSLSQEEIAKQIEKLNEGISVTEKKQNLSNFQKNQVNAALDC